MKKLSVLVSLVILAAAARLLVADADKDDAARIKGTWQVERGDTADGTTLPEDQRKQLTLVIDGTTITPNGMSGGIASNYTLDASKSPGWIDVIAPATVEHLPNFRGIYKLDGDKLTLCLSVHGTRPSDFVLGPGQGDSLLVLKRAAANTTQPATHASTQP